MQPTNETKIPDDEIDVKSLGKRIYSFFAYPLSLFISNIGTSLLFIATAVLVAVILKYSIPKSYKSTFILRPNDKHERFHVKMFGDIKDLLRSRDYKTVASELNINDSVARCLVGINFTNPTYKATADSINYTEVTLDVTDYNKFLPLQASLINYLENNPYFIKNRRVQEKLITLDLEEVNKDLPRLDSLKQLQLRTYGKQPQLTQNSLLLNDLVNPTAFYAAATDRVSKKSSLLARQEYLNNFELIKSCVVVKIYSWPPRILVLCEVLVPLFLIFCVIFLHSRRVMRSRKN